jgi:hypothetical protein
LLDLPEPDLMLRGVPVDGHREFRHAVDLRWAHFIFPEAGHGNCHGFIEACGLDVDGVEQAFAVSVGYAAAGGHATHYSAVFVFCSPRHA